MSDTGPREWFSAAELAEMALPHLPATERSVQRVARRDGWDAPADEGRTWRRRQGRGGGIEYRITLLPLPAQAALRLRFAAPAEATPERARQAMAREDLWAWFDRQTERKKTEARRRLRVLQAVEGMVSSGTSKVAAAMLACSEAGVALSSFYRWEAMVDGKDRADWLPALAPRHAGRAEARAECSPEAWAQLRALYLRREKPTFSACYRKVAMTAQDKGWTLPPERTLFRRMQSLSRTTLIRERDGDEALERMMPAQERDRSVLHALEWVCMDDHRMDVFVRWPGIQKPVRPHLEVVRDEYSGMLLAWRVDLSENTQTIRLAIGDVIEEFGVPRTFLFDNTRAAANKNITGGAPNRFRFKVKEEDPPGLVELLGAQVRFATPYHGQSKSVERSFRDVAGEWAKHPKFAGAYTGNRPDAKPENYGSAAVPLDIFIDVIGQCFEEHNARTGRRSRVCAGRSLREAFMESYERALGEGLIARATAEQRRLFLLQSEVLTIRREQPALHLAGNRYFAEWMLQMPGARVVARFDADALHDDIHVYGLDGRHIGSAECVEPVGFADTAAAREHARKMRTLLRAHRDLAEAERGQMTLREAAGLMPRIERATKAPTVEQKVVRAVFPTAGNTALKRAPDELEDDLPQATREVVVALNSFFPGPQRRSGDE